MPKRPPHPPTAEVRIPVFPLTGALLLPFAQRPLNIFEPRYHRDGRHALAGDRLIGLIQPEDTRGKPAGAGAAAEDRHLGRLTHWEENGEAATSSFSKGMCRFEFVKELPC
jgi:Lon protease-like protein